MMGTIVYNRMLLGGLEVAEVTELMPGVFLAPPEAVPSDTLQQYLAEAPKPSMLRYMAPSFPADLTEEPRLPKAALYRLNNVRPKFVESTHTTQPSKTELDSYSLLYRVAALLTLAGPSSPIVWRNYVELADGCILKGHGGRAWGSAYEETRVSASTKVSQEELTDFKGVLSSYLSLPEDQRTKLDVPLHRLNEAIRHQNSVDKAIDLGIALEALLLADKADPAQLAFQLRTRGAWLLGRTLEERRKVGNQLRALYTYRSKAAHTGKLTSSAKQSDVERSSQDLVNGTRICADAIKAVISAGTIQWDDLILGASLEARSGA